MYLYIFEARNEKQQVIKTYNKFCRYPRKTKVYRQLSKLLEKRFLLVLMFPYYSNNLKSLNSLISIITYKAK